MQDVKDQVLKAERFLLLPPLRKEVLTGTYFMSRFKELFPVYLLVLYTAQIAGSFFMFHCRSLAL